MLKYSYLSPLIYICYALSLYYFFLFYFLFVFFVFYRSLEENEAILEIKGLKDKLGKTLSLLEQSNAGYLRSSALALEHLSKDRAHLCSCAQEGDLLQCDQAHTTCDRAHLCMETNPTATLFWKFLFIRVL